MNRTGLAGPAPTDPLKLTRVAWHLGVRQRSLCSALAVSRNRSLRERLSREREELARELEALRGPAEALAASLGPGHWQVALLRELMRRCGDDRWHLATTGGSACP